MQCGLLIDEIQNRTRDPQGSAHSRATVRDFLDRAQVLLVRATNSLVRTRRLVTVRDTLVYPVNFNQTLRLLDVRDPFNQRLYPLRWSAIAMSSLGWWRQTSAAGPVQWAPLGANWLLLHPGTTNALQFALTIVEQRKPAPLTDDTVELEIPSEHHRRLADLVVALIALRQRDQSVDSYIADLLPDAAQ